jgi:hypothetical protein
MFRSQRVKVSPQTTICPKAAHYPKESFCSLGVLFDLRGECRLMSRDGYFVQGENPGAGKNAMRAITIVLLALLAPALAWAASGGLESVRPLRFEVSDYRDAEGRHWIHLCSEYEGLYGESMDDLGAVLWDFPRSPEVFSRIEAARVRSEAEGLVVTEQRTAVRFLGLAFVSNLVFANSVDRSDPGSVTFSFETIETDGSFLSSKGYWTFTDVSGSGGPATRARFSLDTYIKPIFPGQAVIMRGFGAADVVRAMRELGAGAVARRRRRG